MPVRNCSSPVPHPNFLRPECYISVANMGHPFIMAIPEDPRHSTCWRTVGSGTITTCFNDVSLSRPGIAHRSPACEANTLPQICGRAPTSLSKHEIHEPCCVAFYLFAKPQPVDLSISVYCAKKTKSGCIKKPIN